MPREPGHTNSRTSLRAAAVVGILVLVSIIFLGLQRLRPPENTGRSIPVAEASNEQREASAVTHSASVPTAAIRAGLPASAAPAPRGPVSPVATMRLATKAPAARATDAAPPVTLPASSMAVPSAPALPQRVAEPLPPSPTEQLGAANLRDICGKRGFIAGALCINERCAQAAYAGDAECVKLRRAAEEAELALQRGG